MASISLLRTQKLITTNGYPLGLLYLASFLRTFGNHRVQIIDMKAEVISVKDAERKIADFNTDYIGIGGMTYEALEIHELAKRFKNVFPNTPVILGGPHATTSPEEIISDQNVDFVIIGEGEEPFKKLIDELEHGKKVFETPGVAYRNKNNIVINKRIPASFNLDSLPFPAWDLINISKYFDFTRQSIVSMHHRYMTILTSRGCPYQCTYCHQVFGKKFRARSPENVFEEIKRLYYDYKIREFHVADDTFNLDISRAEKICDLITESNLEIGLSFPNGLRVDIMTIPLLEKLKNAGTFMVSYAIESASPRLQKILKKNIRFDNVKKIIARTGQLGILCNGFFMIGLPGETKEDVETTLKYAWNSRFHTASFFVLNPFPGTEVFKNSKSNAPRKLKDILKKDYNYVCPSYDLSELSNKKLKYYITKANLIFYLNPKRLIRILSVIPHKILFLRLVLRFFGRVFGKY